MEFLTPAGKKLEIPDEWWSAAEMNSWDRGGKCHYTPTDGADNEIISIRLIETPQRSIGTPLFNRERFVSILQGFRCQDQGLPPIEISGPWPARSPQFRLKDGFHRFHASIAVGYSEIPVVRISWQEHQGLIDEGFG